MLHFDYLIKIYLFFTKRRFGASPGFEVSSSGLQDDCSTTVLSGTSQWFVCEKLFPFLLQIPRIRSRRKLMNTFSSISQVGGGLGGRPERRLPFRNACAARLRTRGTLAGILDPETSSLCCAPWRCAQLRSPCSHGHLIQALTEDGAARTVGGARRRRTTAVRGPSLD